MDCKINEKLTDPDDKMEICELESHVTELVPASGTENSENHADELCPDIKMGDAKSHVINLSSDADLENSESHVFKSDPDVCAAISKIKNHVTQYVQTRLQADQII
jgi:hypothetical protein